MTAIAPCTLRHVVGRQTCRLRPAQRRWARVHDVRFVATQQPTQQQQVLERYRQKLDQKAREQGLKDVGELKEVYAAQLAHMRKKAMAPGANTPPPAPRTPSSSSSSSSQQSRQPYPQPPSAPAQPLDQVTPSSPNYKPPGVKTLSSYLDLDKTAALPPQEIESLWRLRFAHRPESLGATIPASTFRDIAATGRRHPQFVLPGLPRKAGEDGDEDAQPTMPGATPVAEGAPIHFLQWTFPSPDTVVVLFTHLAEYKLRGEFAQPHTTLTHHTELAESKGLVLCQGSVLEGRGVSVDEAKWLLMCMQKFYNTKPVDELGGQGDRDVGQELARRRRRLMEQFSRGDAGFQVETLLEEAERLG